MQGVPNLGPLIWKGTQVECDLYDDRPLEALECSTERSRLIRRRIKCNK